jgi:dihydroorotase
MAQSYYAELTSLAPTVRFVMTLYLTPDLTVEEIEKASKSGIIVGVKSYPRGVTTNSDAGIEDYDLYYHLFAEMERVGLVLNLHGEVPSNSEKV